jgi:hypothetical protein
MVDKKLKRIIMCAIPTSVCNFRCHYCYLSQRDASFQGEQAKFEFSAGHIAKAFSIERLGGVCYFNFCADGETLLTKQIDEYIYGIVEQGHYAEIVTNLTITHVLNRILDWPSEILKRVTFKCSFHYLELKKRNLLDTFAANVQRIWAVGCSASIEITPSDELIPYLDEVMDFSQRNFGAQPHITIARNDATQSIDYLTDHTMEEYDGAWSKFGSDFWKFKKTIFKAKRNEYCYAGRWSLLVDLSNGDAFQCYHSRYQQNIFKNVNTPISFIPIGKCKEPHCYNGHMLLTLGCINDFTNVRYGDIKNRVKADGSEWLQNELKYFLNTKLEESNDTISSIQKWKYYLVNTLSELKRCIYRGANKMRLVMRKRDNR